MLRVLNGEKHMHRITKNNQLPSGQLKTHTHTHTWANYIPGGFLVDSRANHV